jgi:hypothetical protein
MTPLAYELLKDLTTPGAFRNGNVRDDHVSFRDSLWRVEPASEGHLTGEKCLHFVRTFLRVRMGQLEYVDAHWRGNPALGMKRSRYRLEEGDSHA